jgi:hypothetical protein
VTKQNTRSLKEIAALDQTRHATTAFVTKPTIGLEGLSAGDFKFINDSLLKTQ